MWIVLVIVIALLISLGLVVFAVKQPKKTIDYKQYFTMGTIFTAVGIPLFVSSNSPAFFIMGLVFMGIGGANKDKWGKPVKLTKKQQNIMKWATIGGVLVLILGILGFILIREGLFVI
jgi:hypothetical protein